MWHRVIYTNALIPARYDAYSVGPIILIREHQIRNRGLLEHECTHVRQFWRTLGLCGLLRLVSKRCRLRYEVEAYREQLKWAGQHQAPVFAYYLCRNYGLRITREQALEALTGSNS